MGLIPIHFYFKMLFSSELQQRRHDLIRKYTKDDENPIYLQQLAELIKKCEEETQALIEGKIQLQEVKKKMKTQDKKDEAAALVAQLLKAGHKYNDMSKIFSAAYNIARKQVKENEKT